MKNKNIGFALLPVAAVLVSGCAISVDTNSTDTPEKKDRTKSSMYAR